MEPAISPTIQGYQIEDLIGEGAYGAVYRARQQAVDRLVAVKIILPEFANRPEFIRRFETEAQLVAQLEHIHIVPLYDYWRDPQGAYLVMRLMKGGSLQDLVEKGPLTIPQTAQILEQVASALSAAHRRKIIHRDLKPANILLDEDGNAYLSDFGIAKAIGEQSDLTVTGAILGTPAFITPEQVQSLPVSPQTDIYALGVVLFTMLTGQHPFPETSPGDLIARHLRDPLPPLAEFNPDVPTELDGVIQRATAKDPTQRYPDVETFLDDFHQALGPDIITAPTRPLTEQILEVSNPYKGLRPFLEADAEDFFGREDLTRQLLNRLSETDQFSRFLAVVGPSGSGKSSLVKAGLMPALRQGAIPGSERWFIVSMTPGSRPLDELEVSLLRVAVERPPDLMAQLQRDGFGLLRAAQLVLPSDEDQLLLVMDQFEELFTLTTDPAQARHFMDLIYQAVTDPHSQVRVVLTLRADFYDRPLMEPDFSTLVQKRTEVVVPLTSAELERAICGPIERLGVSLEPGLDAEIISDVADQPGSLPLLQYALTELFEHRQGRLLTRGSYQSIGGVLGALGRRAEEVYQSLSGDEQNLSQQVFLRLISLGEGVEDTRRRVLRSELTAIDNPDSSHVDQVLEAYGTARLLSFDHDPQTRAPTVEVAHEALLREWERLRTWLDENRADIRLQRLLGAAAQDWLASNEDPSFLLRGSRLAQFEEWAGVTSLALTADEQRYLQASLDDEARRKAQQAALERRSRNFLRALVAVFAVAAIVAVILTIFAFNQQGIAQENALQAEQNAATAQSEAFARATQQAIAESEADARTEAEQQALQERDRAVEAEGEARLQAAIGLAGQALNELDGSRPEVAVPLALEALENYPYTWQAQRALGITVLNHHLDMKFTHNDTLTNMQLSKDGKRLLTSSWDDSVIIWDTESGEKLVIIPDIIDPYAAWSPDENKILILAGNDEIGYWFEIRDGTNGDLLNSQDLESYWGSFLETVSRPQPWSPDGEYFVIYLDDGSVSIFDSESGQETLRISAYEGAGFADWSPTGDLILTDSIDEGLITMWNAANGQEIYSLPASTDADAFKTWSPTGDRFITRDVGDLMVGEVKVFDSLTGNELRVLENPGVTSIFAEFSPDGSQIITSGTQDGSARLWSAETGELISMISGLTQVKASAWSPDGKLAAVGAADGLIRVWDTVNGSVRYEMPIPNDIFYIAWSPQGDRVYAGGPYHPAVWTYRLDQALHTIPGVQGGSGTSDWSPDGQQASISMIDGSFPVWNTETWELQYNLDGGDFFGGILWSPDGSKILTYNAEGPTRIWDAANGELLVDSPYPETYLFDARWSPDGGKIVGTDWWEEGKVAVYDAATLEELLSFYVRGWAGEAIYSPDGERIAVTSFNGEASIRDAETGEVLLQLFPEDYIDQASGVVWTSDGEKVLVFSMGTGHLFNAQTGEDLMQYVGHTSAVFSLNWSPDERLIYTGSGDGTARAFDVATGKELLVYEVGGWVTTALSPDGKQLFVYSGEGIGYVFPTWENVDDLVAYARECCVVRELTPEEREQFGLPPNE